MNKSEGATFLVTIPALAGIIMAAFWACFPGRDYWGPSEFADVQEFVLDACCFIGLGTTPFCLYLICSTHKEMRTSLTVFFVIINILWGLYVVHAVVTFDPIPMHPMHHPPPMHRW
jgi:hypothetical protein